VTRRRKYLREIKAPDLREGKIDTAAEENWKLHLIYDINQNRPAEGGRGKEREKKKGSRLDLSRENHRPLKKENPKYSENWTDCSRGRRHPPASFGKSF